MRLRFGGLVIELEKKGLVTIILLLVVLIGLVVYSASSAGKGMFKKKSQYDDDDDVDERFPLDMGIIVKKTTLRKDGIDENYLVNDDNKDGDEDDEERGGLNVVRQVVKDTDEDEKLKYRKTKGRIKMAMDTVSARTRQNMARAAMAMSLPHRPPDAHYNINVTLSDKTSLDRDIPETRPLSCTTLNYDITILPKVSVIIPFFNEAPTMLLRNIHSILNRSPNDLLQEIILVDDLSYDAPLMRPLEVFIKHIPRIKLIRNDKRSGLIVSRMRGARLAKAPVIIFLDAHSEVNVGWLEPLLDELRRNPKQVLQPFIDGIDNENLIFSKPSNYFKGTFSWDLRYTWTKITDHEQLMAEERGQPFYTPTLVGCAIAVKKDYFFEMGAFDEGMYVWGGENIELAFRVWMCGGTASTVTCSRVGHVFKQSPNKFDGTKFSKEVTVQKNLIRVADVWMDGMRKFFYATTLMFDFKRIKLEPEDLATLRERTELRKKLKCHNFEWYLYNVMPEMLYLPPMDSTYFGEIMGIKTRACWEVTDDYYIGMTYFCFEHKIIPKNNFAFMNNGLLMYRDKCVKINPPAPYMTLAECPKPEEIEQFGTFSIETRAGGKSWGGIMVRKRNEEGVTHSWCIVQVTNAMPEHKGKQMPQLGNCDIDDGFQAWSITYAIDFTLVPEYMSVYEQDLS